MLLCEICLVVVPVCVLILAAPLLILYSAHYYSQCLFCSGRIAMKMMIMIRVATPEAV